MSSDKGEFDRFFAGLAEHIVDNSGIEIRQRDTSNAPLPEAVIMELEQIAERYARGNPFKVGDIVTPRKGYGTKGEGEPMVVLQVLDEPVQNMTDRSFADSTPSVVGFSVFGKRLDMRVAGWSNGSYSPFWSESWEYEFYDEAVHNAPKAGDTKNQ